MPVERHQSHYLDSSPTPHSSTHNMHASSQSLTKRNKSLGDFTDQHEAFAGITTKNAARIKVNQLLETVAKEISLPPAPQTHHHGHTLSRPMIYMSSILQHFGRWYQVCTEKSRGECHSLRFASDPPAVAKIWDDERILRLFIIREELFPVPRGVPVPGSDKAKRVTRHEENCRVLAPYVARLAGARTETPANSRPVNEINLRLTTPGSVPSEVIAKPHPMIEEFRKVVIAEADVLPKYKASARIFYWDNEGDDCLQAILYPDETGFIDLSQSRVALGNKGIELMSRIDRYQFETSAWAPFPKSLPIGPISTPGHPVLIRRAGLESLKDFDDMIHFMSP